jgi:hypothetical protein
MDNQPGAISGGVFGIRNNGLPYMKIVHSLSGKVVWHSQELGRGAAIQDRDEVAKVADTMLGDFDWNVSGSDLDLEAAQSTLKRFLSRLREQDQVLVVKK